MTAQQFGNSSSFRITPKEGIEREILKLNVTKTSQQSDILIKIIKMNVDIFYKILQSEINKPKICLNSLLVRNCRM